MSGIYTFYLRDNNGHISRVFGTPSPLFGSALPNLRNLGNTKMTPMIRLKITPIGVRANSDGDAGIGTSYQN